MTLIASFFVGPFPFIQLTAKVTFLLSIFFLIWFIARNRSASFRHRILVGGLVSIPILAVAPLLLSSHEVPLFHQQTINNFETAFEHASDRSIDDTTPTKKSATNLEPKSWSEKIEAESDTTAQAKVQLNPKETHSVESDESARAQPAQSSGSFRLSVRSMLLLAWSLVSVVLLARFFFAWAIVWIGIRRSQQLATASISPDLVQLTEDCHRKGIQFRLHETDGQMPYCFGVFRSTIMLPREFPEWKIEDQESVILHESAHAIRRDCLINFGAHLQRAILWFHPLSWLLLRFLKSESEMACDDWALSRGVDRVNYAASLFDVTMSTRRKPTVAAVSVSMADCSPLERRMRSILSSTVERNPASIACQLGIATFAIATALTLSAFHFGSVASAQGTSAASSYKVEHRIELKDNSTVKGALEGTVKLETRYGHAKLYFDRIRSLKSIEGGRHEIRAEDGSVLTGTISQSAFKLSNESDGRSIDVSSISKVTTIGNANLLRGKLASGFLPNNITYHIRAPFDYEPAKTYPAIVFFHDANANTDELITAFAESHPEISEQVLLIGLNGENKSKTNDDGFNYTYIDFVGMSDKYTGFPGTDRQSPALVTESITELTDRIPISKVYLIGEGSGAYLAFSVHMNYPGLVDGTIAINGGLLIQCVPDAYTNPEQIAAQKQTPLWIMFHSPRLASYSNSLTSAAHGSFKHAEFPNLKLSTKKSKEELPIEKAIAWFRDLESENGQRPTDSN